jgi:hypothetical protein
MAFVKIVEGSEIYNFPIHYFVHFYSKFWSFACSNGDSAKRVRASWRRAALCAATSPAPVCVFRRRHPPRRLDYSPAARAARRPRRTTAGAHHTVHRSVPRPPRTRAGRGASYHGGISVVDVMRPRATLFKRCPPLSRAPLPSRPPLTAAR